MRMAFAASASGTWWYWMFCRVVMWPFTSGVNCSAMSANASSCSGFAPERKLHPDHLAALLALAVDALLQAEADERLLGLLALEEAARAGIEVVELPLRSEE